MLRLIATVLIAMGLIAPFGTASVAEPLEPAECKALQSQKNTLLTKTVRSALRRGPDWVKEHLHDEDQIEKVREYLLVEEKVAFRCRTDGVRVPKPLPPPLPDRKPPVPTFVAGEENQKILAGMAATSLLPLRNRLGRAPKPSRPSWPRTKRGQGTASAPRISLPPLRAMGREQGLAKR